MSWSNWNSWNLLNFLNWRAPVAPPPTPTSTTPVATHEEAPKTPLPQINVETAKEKLQRQQTTLKELLNNWSVPVGSVKSFLENPDVISSLFYNPDHDEILKKKRWEKEIADLHELISLFKENPIDLSTLNANALFVLSETVVKTTDLIAELMKRMEQETYETTRKWMPELIVHNALLNGDNYSIFFKLIDFKSLTPEMKQTIVNRCQITLLVDPSFRSCLAAFDKEKGKVYLRNALNKFLTTFTDKAVYLWFCSDKEKIARFAAYVAESPELAALASSAFKEATHREFFEQQLKIHRTAYELASYVRAIVESSHHPIDTPLETLSSSLETYPCGEIYTKFAGRPQFAAQRLSKETLALLANILKETNPRFLQGVHWVGLVKMWPIIQSPDVKKEILDQLASARSEHHWDEIKHPFLDLSDYENLEKILPQEHEDYISLASAKENLAKTAK